MIHEYASLPSCHACRRAPGLTCALLLTCRPWQPWYHAQTALPPRCGTRSRKVGRGQRFLEAHDRPPDSWRSSARALASRCTSRRRAIARSRRSSAALLCCPRRRAETGIVKTWHLGAVQHFLTANCLPSWTASRGGPLGRLLKMTGLDISGCSSRGRQRLFIYGIFVSSVE